MAPSRDPGDAVPPGVAPQSPAPLTPEDQEVRKKFEKLPETGQDDNRDDHAEGQPERR